MDDRELIRQIHRGRKDLVQKIAEKYYDDIYRFCLYQTGNQEDSYDLAQETFLKFIRYLDGYRYRNLKGYLLTIAMNLCRDYFTRHNVRAGEDCPTARLEELKAPERPAGEIRLTLTEALMKLPETQREAIVLLYVYGYRYREIAGMTETGLSTVKSRVRRGTMKLRELLCEEDFYG